MDNPTKKHIKGGVQVKVSPAAVEVLAVQIEELEKLAGKVAIEAGKLILAVRELRQQFEATKVMVGAMMGGGHK